MSFVRKEIGIRDFSSDLRVERGVFFALLRVIGVEMIQRIGPPPGNLLFIRQEWSMLANPLRLDGTKINRHVLSPCRDSRMLKLNRKTNPKVHCDGDARSQVPPKCANTE